MSSSFIRPFSVAETLMGSSGLPCGTIPEMYGCESFTFLGSPLLLRALPAFLLVLLMVLLCAHLWGFLAGTTHPSLPTCPGSHNRPCLMTYHHLCLFLPGLGECTDSPPSGPQAACRQDWRQQVGIFVLKSCSIFCLKLFCWCV